MTYGRGFNSRKYGYATVEGGNITKAYSQWHSMLRRCYGGHQNYADCTVCEEWLDYQEFAKWHEEAYPESVVALELDKDIRVPGNRVYSPSTCLFVTKKENLANATEKLYAFASPYGVATCVVNLTEFCKSNNLTHSCMSRVASGERLSHKGWTLVAKVDHL